MNLSLIGCGYWGKNYVNTFENISEAKLKYVYDAAKPSIILPKQILFTQNLDDILKDPEIKGIIIAIPTRKMYEVVKKCLESGKHVLMEKPMTESSKKAKQLIDIAKKHNSILMVGHVFNYHPAIIKLKELIDQKELGNIKHIYSIRVAPGPVRNSNEINALWDLAPHDISIFLYLLGENPIHTKAFATHFLREEVMDSASFSLKFKDIMAEAHVRWWDAEKIRKFTVIGDKRIAIFDELAQEKLKVYNKKVEIVNGKTKIIDEGSYAPEIGNISPLENQCRHFIGCIEKGKKPLTDGMNGYNVVKILEEIERSIKK